jgi:CheY-like chemotaxis protein
MNLRVSDTGMGIREEDMIKLFGGCSQADTMGLARAKRLAQMMSGNISVKSEYGRGTTFTVRLLQGFVSGAVIGKEIAENLRELCCPMARQDRNNQSVRAPVPSAKVLVVDDVATNLDLARGIMKPYGMSVDCVTSGQAAIDLIRGEEPRYNAIFMDHMMPGMDGIETVKIIRNEIDSEYARTVPIIALTANAITGNEEMFLNNGFQDFLTKPIDIMKMDRTINRWVRNKEPEKYPCPEAESRIADNAPDTARKADERIQQLLAQIIRTVPVEGLEAEQGLERFGGDGKSYMDSLRSYVVHTPPLLGAARTVDALEDYAITVHGIKGSSYGISARTIGQMAENLEHAAKAGDHAFIETGNDGFIEAAGKLIMDIQGLLDILEDKLQRPIRATPDPMLLARICDAAGNYDMGGLDEAMEELERYTYEADTGLVSWLKEQIGKSEFEEITERLMPQDLILYIGA